MAITKSVSFRGITLPNAYMRIDRIMGGKYSGFQVEAGIYAAAGEAQPLTMVGFSFEYVAGQDVLPTAYAAMKTIPEFADATDC